MGAVLRKAHSSAHQDVLSDSEDPRP